MVAGVALCVLGCRTVVREMQRSESLDAPERLALQGVELTLTTHLWIDAPPDAKRGELHGRLVVEETQGRPMPSDLRLYHFQVIHRSAGGALSNFRLPGEGVRASTNASNIVLEFHLEGYRTEAVPFDVAVSLTDKSEKRYILLGKNQPVSRGAPADHATRTDIPTFTFDAVERVGRVPHYYHPVPKK
jgi:hypothetical protein